jgi:hypothetical protein
MASVCCLSGGRTESHARIFWVCFGHHDRPVGGTDWLRRSRTRAAPREQLIPPGSVTMEPSKIPRRWPLVPATRRGRQSDIRPTHQPELPLRALIQRPGNRQSQVSGHRGADAESDKATTSSPRERARFARSESFSPVLIQPSVRIPESASATSSSPHNLSRLASHNTAILRAYT